MNPDGSDEALLTNNDFVDNDPSFSPDGKRVALESNRDGGSEVYTMNADGTGPVNRLTTNGAPEDRGTNWSPDGSKIVFHSTRDPQPAGASTFEIYTMNADGSNQTRLTNNTFQDSLPAWSPDGTRIAFLSTRDGDFEVYTMDTDGNNVVRVTTSLGEDSQPSWSPDGKQLVFHSRRTGAIDIYRQNADGTGDATRLTSSTAFEYFPVWSPDGKRIAFNANYPDDPTRTNIYTISAVDGGDLTRVTTAPGTDARCDWQTIPLTSMPTPMPSLTPTPSPTPTVVRDTTPPVVTLSGVPSSMSVKAFLKGVRARVTRNESSSIDARLEGSAKKATLAASFNLSLASRAVSRGTGAARITLKPSKKLVGSAKKISARVRVVVTDVAGNRRTVTKSIKVKR